MFHLLRLVLDSIDKVPFITGVVRASGDQRSPELLRYSLDRFWKGGAWASVLEGPGPQMLAAKQTPYLGSFELPIEVVRLWSLARQDKCQHLGTFGVHGQLSNLILILTYKIQSLE
jgi:hypothetical protein